MIVEIKVKNLGKITDPRFNIPEIKDNLPVRPAQEITLVLKNESTAVASAFRRVAIDELVARCLYFDIDAESFIRPTIENEEGELVDDKEQIDPYILVDNIQRQIMAISINYKMPKNAKFHLKVHNSSNKTISVTAADLKPNMDFGNVPMFNHSFIITRLVAGKTLEIKNIRPVDYAVKLNQKGNYVKYPGIGRNDALFSWVSSGCGLRAVGIEKYHRGKGTSSANSMPTDYEVYLETNGFIEPKTLLNLICENVKRRCRVLLDTVSDAKEGNNFGSQVKDNKEDEEDISGVSIIFTKEVTLFKIAETHTILNLLRERIYTNNPNIGLVNYVPLSDPKIDIYILQVKSPKSLAEFRKALNDIIDKFTALGKQVNSKI